jgi:hypothetical protein
MKSARLLNNSLYQSGNTSNGELTPTNYPQVLFTLDGVTQASVLNAQEERTVTWPGDGPVTAQITWYPKGIRKVITLTTELTNGYGAATYPAVTALPTEFELIVNSTEGVVSVVGFGVCSAINKSNQTDPGFQPRAQQVLAVAPNIQPGNDSSRSSNANAPACGTPASSVGLVDYGPAEAGMQTYAPPIKKQVDDPTTGKITTDVCLLEFNKEQKKWVPAATQPYILVTLGDSETHTLQAKDSITTDSELFFTTITVKIAAKDSDQVYATLVATDKDRRIVKDSFEMEVQHKPLRVTVTGTQQWSCADLPAPKGVWIPAEIVNTSKYPLPVRVSQFAEPVRSSYDPYGARNFTVPPHSTYNFAAYPDTVFALTNAYGNTTKVAVTAENPVHVHKNKLSTADIVGITVAAVAVAVLIGLLVWLIVRHRRKQHHT